MKPQNGRYRLPYDVTEEHVRLIEEMSELRNVSKAQIVREAIYEKYEKTMIEISIQRG